MASVRFTDVQARPSAFLDLTSLTREEFQQLVLPFEAAFQAHLVAWRLDGCIFHGCLPPSPWEGWLLANLCGDVGRGPPPNA
jgi:hypothetical protein